jgi:dihydrofolate synthase/folylpolyglutamate synthase
MTVSMAFDFFARRRVDIAVIEVGLGGRLDSTNIITPIVSVITNIGHDHMDLLGETLEKVAGEKAGISKIGVPVVIGETQKETVDAFISKADETGSEIHFADKEFTCSLEDAYMPKGGRKYSLTDISTHKLHKGTTALGGDYQVKNLVTVYSASRRMKEVMDLSDDNIRDGIKNVIVNTGLSGRWQVIGNKPLTVCDTGHNKEGLEYLVRQIDRIPKKKLHMIIGFVNDKDLTAVLPLFPVNAAYYFTKASVERALNENILKEMAGSYGLNGNSFPDVSSAIAAARKSASPDDMIFIGGSTFVVAECL